MEHNGLRKLCDCDSAKWTKCPHPWHFNYRGVRVSVDVQAGYHLRTRGEAEILARGWRDQIDTGLFVKRERGGPIVAQRKARAATAAFTFADFATKYLTEYCDLKRAGKTKKDKQCPEFYVFAPMLTHTLPDGRALGDVPFAEVDETLYEHYVSTRRDSDYATSTVNKDVSLIKAMCRWATRRKLYGPQGENPITGESRILVRKDVAQRQRPISDTELTAMKAHADPRLWAYIEIAIITCLRLTELYRLVWGDVKLHLQELWIRPDATKVESAARKVPLDPRASAILEWLRIDPAGERYPDSEYVFGECGTKPIGINDRFNTMLLKAFPGESRIAWENGVLGTEARQRLEAIDLKFGDLRHEGALRKYRDGWRLNVLQQLLGHTNLKQTSTYLGVGHEETKRAMQEYGSGAKVIAVLQSEPGILQSVCNPARKSAKKGSEKQGVTH